ncbi:MAG TPA: type I polyketide synthase, partial [Acidimicrobiales bacterium]|nr:type I polyketide synthase [Acidimicrobiales bacterium]
MDEHTARAAAVVGVGAILPDAPDVAAFWRNLTEGRYSITEVDPARWDPALYYDPDPRVPDKAYSKIGGWVRDYQWDPLGWRLPIPPRVSDAMDGTQKWAIACGRQALLDAGWPDWDVDPERTAVIVGNAMAGENHYQSALRIAFPEIVRFLEGSPSFAGLSKELQAAVVEEAHERLAAAIPAVSEDTMPGELANIVAGRIANVFNLRGPNFVADAACASAMAAMSSALKGLVDGDYDAVVTGGVDRNMGASTFVKFCKIGALSATGTRPYGAGADGFVMGEGAAMFVLKRLADAERDGDRIYAVLLGVGGSSDGKGKGITAPNPLGQRLAVERAWRAAGVAPETASCVEGHGTSTRVGDTAEVEALSAVFAPAPAGSIALGSVKSNLGHLKGAAGAAGVLKTVLALHHKVLPASLNAETPNPGIDFARSPFRVNTALAEWPAPQAGGPRRAGVSAFGFGGTNFHTVLEEYLPGRGGREPPAARARAAAARPARVTTSTAAPAATITASTAAAKAPLRGALVVGAGDEQALGLRLRTIAGRAAGGWAPPVAPPARADLAAPVRVAIDFTDAADLAAKATQADRALAAGRPEAWKALRGRGIHLGRGPAPRTAFLYPGQGSQYVNMLKDLAAIEPIVADTFAEADRAMTPLLGRPLTEYVFIDGDDPEAVAALEQQLLQTEITQPAVLTADIALTRLLAAYGIEPDMVMGHSLGEYAALVAGGALTFAAALEAVSARGREMAHLALEDNGAMAAVMAPLDEIERIVAASDGYVVVANVNSLNQAVIGGATTAVLVAMDACTAAGYQVVRLPVSHAFHTSIVAPASEPLRATLERLELRPPRLPVVANVTGRFYPTDADAGAGAEMLEMLGRQVASPVQFVAGLRTLREAGARMLVEVGPKRALQTFSDDVLGAAHDDAVSLFVNHPKVGGVASFNQALCGLYAAGLGAAPAPAPAAEPSGPAVVAAADGGPQQEMARLFDEFGRRAGSIVAGLAEGARLEPSARPAPVVVSGAGLGLPGTERVFDDANVGRILGGEQFIRRVPDWAPARMLDKHITRLVKREGGDPTFDTIADASEVIRLAARGGALDLVEEFGV